MSTDTATTWNRHVYFYDTITLDKPADYDEVHEMALVVNNMHWRFTLEREQHKADLEAIGSVLKSQAITRGFCDEYETFLDALLPSISIFQRENFREVADRRVEWTVTMVRTVKAVNEYNARNEVASNIPYQWYASVLAERVIPLAVVTCDYCDCEMTEWTEEDRDEHIQYHENERGR